MKDRTAEFLEFCRGKPADEAYEPLSSSMCALGQFGLRIHGMSCEANGIPLSVYHAAVFKPPYTFGDLADRLSR